MIKRHEIGRADSCLSHAKDDEPIFVLRAKDPLSSAVVDYWARLAMTTGLHEHEKGHEAHRCALDMLKWRQKNK